MTSPIYDPLTNMMRQAIDLAVYNAVQQAIHSDSYTEPLSIELIEREQLKTFVHNEWRLVQAEYERKAEMLILRPPTPIIIPKDQA